MRYIGVDPGGTTGIVVFYDNDYIWSYQVVGFFSAVDIIDNLIREAIDQDEDIMVICEAWVDMVHPNAVDSNSPVQIIGALRWICAQHQVGIRLQNPHVRDAVTDKMLRNTDLWIKGAEHARQAMKHVLAYFLGKFDPYWMKTLMP